MAVYSSGNSVKLQDSAFLINILKRQCHEIFASGFFHESVSVAPLILPIGPFQFFSKICDSGLPNGKLDKIANGKNLQAEKSINQ
jgi:hypothetical protein